MNRTLKEATVKKYHYQTHQHLKEHLHAFLMAYNFAKRLKTLKGLTPYEYICQMLANRARTLYHQSVPSHPGTKHIAGFCIGVQSGLSSECMASRMTGCTNVRLH